MLLDTPTHLQLPIPVQSAAAGRHAGLVTQSAGDRPVDQLAVVPGQHAAGVIRLTEGGSCARRCVGARPAWSDRRVAEVVCGVAVALSIVFAAIALRRAGQARQPTTPFPIWVVLVLLAVVLLVSARREMEDIAAPVSIDGVPTVSSERTRCRRIAGSTRADAAAGEPPRPMPIGSRTRDESRRSRSRQEEIEAEEERLVDGILSRLHAHGMDSLTAEERALLQRVSARYRSRLGRRT